MDHCENSRHNHQQHAGCLVNRLRVYGSIFILFQRRRRNKQIKRKQINYNSTAKYVNIETSTTLVLYCIILVVINQLELTAFKSNLAIQDSNDQLNINKDANIAM